MDVVLHIECVNIVVIHFGWSGDQNWVFRWRRIKKFMSFCTAQMMLRLSEMLVA